MVNADRSKSNWIPGEPCQAELRECAGRDPEDVKIYDSPKEKVLQPVLGSFSDPKRCYCCASPATVTLSFSQKRFAACEICAAWLHSCWTHMAAMATRYNENLAKEEA